MIPVPLLLRRLLAGVFLLGVVVLNAAAAEPRSFNLPGGPAEETLKLFAKQAGREIVFAGAAVAQVKTNPVSGELSPREALTALLANTGLVASEDNKSGAFAVRREATAEKNVPARLQEIPATEGNKSGMPVEGGVVKLEDYTVTGTRVRGLLEGSTAQPVLTIDSAQIDRTGAQSIGDLLRYIPQISAFTTGQASTQVTVTTLINVQTGTTTLGGAAGTIDASAGRVTATIRGAPAGATLLLIDGKRVPKNSQKASGDGYDLNGIPLAAVERIEVLLDGASSIYGADAMGGVINVILKKNYRGTELRLAYENTFDSDAGVRTVSLSHGFSVGKLRGLITASYEDANAMALRDRSFLASYDRRPYGGGDFRNVNTPGGAGRISRTGTVPLPGLTTTQSAIPSGTIGTGLTVADYLNAGAVAAPFDLGQYMDYASAYERSAFLANFDYALRPWLEVYVNARVGRNRNTSAGAPLIAQNLSVPIGYPGNPFPIAVTLNKWFEDIRPEIVSTNDTETFTFGANGLLPKRWRYDASVARANSHLVLDGDAGASITSALLTAAIAAGQRPNLFYDSTRVPNPNAAGVLEALTTPTRDEEDSETWTYSLQFDGPVYELPGGDIATALGVERREEYVDFPLRLATDTTNALPGNETVSAYFAEVVVPVFGADFRKPLFRQLNLSGSYRYENYDSGGTSKNPRMGVAWRPSKWLLVRGSYGEGFKVPTLQQRTAPRSVINSNTAATTANLDPLRGNTVNAIYPVTRGGKPDLRPESSENVTLGLVADIPGVEGLSFSADWFDNLYNDRVGTLVFSQMALLYPERIARGPNLATDPAGWAGPVTSSDLRPINVSDSQITGYDIGLRFERRMAWGETQASLSGTKYTKNVLVPTPGGPASTAVNTDSLPVQVNGNAFLFRNAWGAGVLATYRAANRATTSRAVTPSAIRWDLQFNYDFAKASWLNSRNDWLRKVLANNKLSLTVFNVLNREPPLDYSFFPDNTVLDSRLRRFGLSLRKQF